MNLVLSQVLEKIGKQNTLNFKHRELNFKIMDIKDLNGSIVAIVTPFKEDGSIDYEKFDELIEWHIAQGTNGIVVCGTTGESPALNEQEGEMLIKHAVIKVDKRIPVIAGSGNNCTQKTIQYSRIDEKSGVDALLIVSPYYNRPTQHGMYLHFGEVAKSVNVPIILYNVPSRTGSAISPQLAIDLAKAHNNIIGIKEAAGNLGNFADLLEKRPKGFKVFSGDDFLAVPANLLGADGCISVVANVIPRDFADMMNASINGEISKSRQMFFKYKKLTELLFVETNPIPVKTALAAMKKISEFFRLPLCEMGSENKQMLLNELVDLQLIK